ncbi:hypothetical protein M0804_000391 [Polistes exclamans]|nr:hypothetical protein M0804_000391 [Polistes exclamans]
MRTTLERQSWVNVQVMQDSLYILYSSILQNNEINREVSTDNALNMSTALLGMSHFIVASLLIHGINCEIGLYVSHKSFVFQALPITNITQPGVARRPGMKKCSKEYELEFS